MRKVGAFQSLNITTSYQPTGTSNGDWNVPTSQAPHNRWPKRPEICRTRKPIIAPQRCAHRPSLEQSAHPHAVLPSSFPCRKPLRVCPCPFAADRRSGCPLPFDQAMDPWKSSVFGTFSKANAVGSNQQECSVRKGASLCQSFDFYAKRGIYPWRRVMPKTPDFHRNYHGIFHNVSQFIFP